MKKWSYRIISFMASSVFFDCIFEKQLIVKNNIFKKGTDLLTRENKGFDNCFNGGVILTDNIGPLNVMP